MTAQWDCILHRVSVFFCRMGVKNISDKEKYIIDYIKIKNFCSANNTNQESEKTTHKMDGYILKSYV